MIDLNTLFSNALTAAITNAVAPLNERIAVLEQRVDTLSSQDVAMGERIAALENNPAQGVDTQAPSVLAAQYTPISNEQIKAALQEWATKDALIDYLNEQEWFWDKMRNFIDAAIEEAIDNHCETYDHDSYDSAVSDLEDRDFDDYVTNDSLEDAVRDAVRNLSFDISVS